MPINLRIIADGAEDISKPMRMEIVTISDSGGAHTDRDAARSQERTVTERSLNSLTQQRASGQVKYLPYKQKDKIS